MSGMKVDFSEVEGSFEPLPEGAYECVIERIEVRESNSSDHDYLNWELKVTEDDYEDRRLWMITSFSPKALFRLKDIFVALDVIEGDEELDLEWADDVDVTPKEGPLLTDPDLIGVAVVAVVTNEMYDGRERNRVDDLKGVGRSAPAAKKSSNGKAKASGTKSKPKGKARARKLR